VSEGTELDVVDVDVEDTPGTDLAIPGEAALEEVVDGVIEPEDTEPGEIVVDDIGLAYPEHQPRQATSDAADAATTGEGFSGAGFKWTKDGTGNGPGGGGGRSKPGRRRLGRRGSGGGGGSGGGFHFSLIGAIFPNAALIKTGSIASNNASGNAPSVISTGRPARKPRPRRK
jgi:hypothetical protein